MLLGGNYLGQSQLGGFGIIPYVRGDVPLIKDIIPSFRYTSGTYDELSAYDAADTYDGSETLQQGFGNFAVVQDIQKPSPFIKRVIPSHTYSSTMYDEISPYDDLDTYDGSEVVQTQPGNDILFDIRS